MTGYFATPGSDHPVPGVLVAHEASGMSDHTRTCALALAARGYAAFALDLYGVEGFPRDEQVARHNQLIETPGLFLKRAHAGLATLRR